jgi:hypothetical protein
MRLFNNIIHMFENELHLAIYLQCICTRKSSPANRTLHVSSPTCGCKSRELLEQHLTGQPQLLSVRCDTFYLWVHISQSVSHTHTSNMFSKMRKTTFTSKNNGLGLFRIAVNYY